MWQDDYLRWRVGWSVLQAAATCVAALALGLPVAWVLARFEFTGRSLCLRLLMLPFVVPTLVAAIGVLALWGPHGLLADLLGLDLQGTPWLLLYGNLFFNLCLVVRAGKTSATAVISAQRQLGQAGARIAGFVLNGVRATSDGYYSRHNAADYQREEIYGASGQPSL